MGSPLTRQPAFLSLVLFSVLVSVLVDCRAMLMNVKQRPQETQQRRFHAGTRAESVTAVGRFYLELRKPVKRGISKYFGVNLPVGTDRVNVVSIKKRLLCINSKRRLYNSRQKDTDDCLFYHIWLDLMKHRAAFDPTGRSRLLHMMKAEFHTAHKPPDASSAPTEPSVKRKRRSEEVNPSDPLGSHPLPSHAAKYSKAPAHGQHEQDQAGAVSKETIASCDDPLRVLQSQGPVSPVKTNIAEWAEPH
ncbi:uncharacterized protein LOC114857057 [Betta splendens]|uniref:Uncharacterized protein LOC114857057 n=1 Tax=Betta splendens TaxID=158456 RepID=A0A6P7MRX3_BETSP|nr:uncharacterized protein LOC114857057 [Betta splendens]